MLKTIVETILKKRCPCNNCLLIPVCRHKSFLRVLSDCDPVMDFCRTSAGNDVVSEQRIHIVGECLGSNNPVYTRSFQTLKVLMRPKRR